MLRGVRNCCAIGSKSRQQQSHGSAVLYTTWLWSTARATWWMESAIFYSFWSSLTAALAHGIWHIVFFFLFEIFIFFFCYGRILVVIRPQARVNWTKYLSWEPVMIKTMITVSAVYIITWRPNFVFYMLQHITPSHRMYNARLLSDFLAFLYISANPFIYAVMFHPVRRVLMRLIPWKKSPKPPAEWHWWYTRCRDSHNPGIIRNIN